MFNRTTAFFAVSLLTLTSFAPLFCKIMTITSEDQYNKKAMKSKKPTVVAFKTKGCRPCEKIESKLKEFAKARPDVDVYEVNMGEEKAHGLVDKLNIHTAPTTVLLKDGKEVARIEGGEDYKKNLEAKIDQNFDMKKS